MGELPTSNFLIQYAVSHKTESNAWADFCKQMNESYGQFPDLAVVARGIRVMEEQYKQITGEKRLPARYRSSKSLVMDALRFGIALIDAKGEAVPKNVVGDLVKGAKVTWRTPPSVTVATAYTQFKNALTALDVAIQLLDTVGDAEYLAKARKDLKDAGYL